MMIGYTLFLGLFAMFSAVVACIMLSSLFGFWKTGVPFYITPQKEIELWVKRLGISDKDHVLDLGSGHGKVLFAVERLSGARTTGYELTGWTHWYARISGLILRSKAQLLRQNFFEGDLSNGTVIYCYLYPHIMEQVGHKLKRDCRSGTIVVSRDFRIPNLQQIDYFRTHGIHELFIYKV